MSDLLNQASLVMVPSGYKEDTVYSVVPSDGSGDLAFTRASNGTRINSAGLVEVCPWNLLQYSENFANAYWTKDNITITANATTNPVNGQNTATAIIATAVFTYHSLTLASFSSSQPSVISIFVKAGSKSNVEIEFGSGQISFNLSTQTINYQTNATGTIESYGNGWYRISAIVPSCSYIAFIVMPGTGTSEGWTGDGTTTAVYYYGAQLNIGSTAKPYFPTTDRLNVPRLTYQNGGGGCPSLLLEKQSTNLILSSQDFSNTTYWAATTSSGSVTTTANYAASPDGTQNATRLQLSYNGGGGNYAQIYQALSLTIGQSYTVSVWLKSLSGTPTILLGYYNASENNPVTLTTEWVRHTLSFTASSVDAYPKLALGFGFSSTSADFLAWGYQIEASSYATSYIPTTSSSATRVADACSKTGISSLIGQTEGVIFVQIQKMVDGYNYFSISDGTSSNWIFVGQDADTPNKIRGYVKAGGVVYADISSGVIANGTVKMAIAYKANDVVLYVNGSLIGSDTSVTIPSSLTSVSLNNLPSSAQDLICSVDQFALFKTRLTNAELASLTTI